MKLAPYQLINGHCIGKGGGGVGVQTKIIKINNIFDILNNVLSVIPPTPYQNFRDLCCVNLTLPQRLEATCGLVSYMLSSLCNVRIYAHMAMR